MNENGLARLFDHGTDDARQRHSKRTLEAVGRSGNGLRNLAPDNSLLRSVPHLELPTRNLRGGDNFKIGVCVKAETLYQAGINDTSELNAVLERAAAVLDQAPRQAA